MFRPALFVALLMSSIHAQPLTYHCGFEARLAAAKQTAETITSEDGAYAYSLVAGQPYRWGLRGRPVIEWYGATNMSTEANALVTQAFQDWEDISSIDFDRLGENGNSEWPKQDGISQVLVADPADLGGAQGLTQRFGTFGVTETDIGLDPNLVAGSNDAFKRSILRHEIGHLLGLQHVASSASLMFATILTGSTKPIDQGSLDGIAFLYGAPLDLQNLNQARRDTLGTGIRAELSEHFGVGLTQAPDRPGEIFVSVGAKTQEFSVFPSSGTVWHSKDGGESWLETSGIQFEMIGSGAAVETGTGVWEGPAAVPASGPAGLIDAIGYQTAPGSQVMYAAANAVYRSDDGGQTWTFLFATPFVSAIPSIVVQTESIVYIGTDKGMFKTIDSGDSWIELSEGLPDPYTVNTLAQDPDNVAVLYAGGVGGVYRSTNGGILWSRLGAGISAAEARQVRLSADGGIYAVTNIGAFKLSSDETTWERIGTEFGSYAVIDLLVDAQDPKIIYVTSRDGVYRSDNAGSSFSQVFPSKAPVIALASTDLVFGDVEVGKSGTVSLSVTNDGLGALIISDVTSEIPGFSLADSPITLSPGEAASITFRIDQDTEGAIAGSATLLTNDPNTPQIVLAVSGTGVIILADSRADFDADGDVDFTDFLGFAATFGSSDAGFDIDGSGTVDFTDFLIFAASFGRPLS